MLLQNKNLKSYVTPHQGITHVHPHKWLVITQMLREGNHTDNIIGEDGITAEEIKFVISHSKRGLC